MNYAFKHLIHNTRYLILTIGVLFININPGGAKDAENFYSMAWGVVIETKTSEGKKKKHFFHVSNRRYMKENWVTSFWPKCFELGNELIKMIEISGGYRRFYKTGETIIAVETI